MEDDPDINLSLNLSTFTGRGEQKTRERVKGNRAQRIRQRRQLKSQRQREPQTGTGQELVADGKRKFGSDDELDDESPVQSKRQKTDGHPRGKVTGVKEEVFASTKFSDLPLHPHLISNLEQRMGLATMTRVQQMSIPVILKDRDTLIKSQTGSGKTLAYAVPIVHTLATRAQKTKRQDGPYALIVVPTRELAVQSLNTFSSLLQSAVWIVAGSIMGGEKRKAEKARLRKGINILVTTPGRLLDHIQHTDSLSLRLVRWLVLDEADRMLDMGYEKDVAQIVTALNRHAGHYRQTILLSATLTAGVERLAGIALTDHEMVDASSQPEKVNNMEPADTSAQDAEFALPEKLKQNFVMVPCKLRLVTLAAFILWKCKDSVEFHHTLFSQAFGSASTPARYHDDSDDGEDMVGDSDEEGGGGEPLSIFKLHGDMAQKERTKVFQDFTAARCGVLLCTDVAARGLHLPRVDWIVQYTTPGATVDYIHRVGRTARAGKQGNALLFLMPSEADYIKELNKHKISVHEISMKDILMVLLTAIHELPQPQVPTKRQDPRTFEEAATYLQDRFEEQVFKNRNLQTLAAKGYQSFVRAYATYPSHLKDVFSMKDLHLGHVAKSFALRESPSHLHSAASRPIFKVRKMEGKSRSNAGGDKRPWKPHGKKGPYSATVSEFGSGLDSAIMRNVAKKNLKGKKKKPGF
ncbi:hypothetical protein BaRGS_00035746 [Batillaria attramentaria]|uniref:ATP-dependent RNA helicase n=1 Tax=Batillaria attramentaria TaxID=370345 RepID=A0ABD0JF19_9CAEN